MRFFNVRNQMIFVSTNLAAVSASDVIMSLVHTTDVLPKVGRSSIPLIAQVTRINAVRLFAVAHKSLSSGETEVLAGLAEVFIFRMHGRRLLQQTIMRKQLRGEVKLRRGLFDKLDRRRYGRRRFVHAVDLAMSRHL